MKRILVLGAGKSSPYLINYFVKHAQEYNWFVTVGDLDVELARSRIGNCARADAIRFDINDTELRAGQIAKSDLVINMLAPKFQYQVALTCVEKGVPMISVSYEDSRIRDLEQDAVRKGILILTEIGLDPGIDHMSAAELIARIRQDGGKITSFESYGGGLPAPDSLINPFNYVISWNPRNVVMAGEKGAQYLENGKIKIIPYHNVFRHTWPLEVPGIGLMEAYPNRDSLYYQSKYGFTRAETVIRGTIRYPGWSETWFNIVKLGLPNETLRIPDLEERTYAELTEMFLPNTGINGGNIEQRVANYLNISPTGKIIEKMRWLGLFSNEKIGIKVQTAAEVMTHLLSRKLALTDQARDMVILMHRIEAVYADKKKRITSTMVHYGERAGFTSMAKSVGLPAALVGKLILTGELPLTGCHIPTHPAIYEPVLKELAKEGFGFEEQEEVIQ